jgi:hypothetical protein
MLLLPPASPKSLPLNSTLTNWTAQSGDAVIQAPGSSQADGLVNRESDAESPKGWASDLSVSRAKRRSPISRTCLEVSRRIAGADRRFALVHVAGLPPRSDLFSGSSASGGGKGPRTKPGASLLSAGLQTGPAAPLFNLTAARSEGTPEKTAPISLSGPLRNAAFALLPRSRALLKGDDAVVEDRRHLPTAAHALIYSASGASRRVRCAHAKDHFLNLQPALSRGAGTGLHAHSGNHHAPTQERAGRGLVKCSARTRERRSVA